MGNKHTSDFHVIIADFYCEKHRQLARIIRLTKQYAQSTALALQQARVDVIAWKTENKTDEQTRAAHLAAIDACLSKHQVK